MIVNSAALLKIKNNYFDQLSQIKKQCRQKIDLLKQAKDVVRLTSFDYPLVFDYVAQKFPSVNIHAATVFICDLNVFEVIFPELSNVGILGFYDRFSKAVVIPQIVSLKISQDEIVVHELLHYVSDARGYSSASWQLEEEFAYGYSIDYLRGKGWKDEDIASSYIGSYAISIVGEAKAMDYAKQIIAIYSSGEKTVASEPLSRIEFLNL